MVGYVRKKTILVGTLITAGILNTSVQAKTYNPEVDAANYGYFRVDGDEEWDDDKDAYQAFADYGLNQYIAVEDGYIDFGN